MSSYRWLLLSYCETIFKHAAMAAASTTPSHRHILLLKWNERYLGFREWSGHACLCMLARQMFHSPNGSLIKLDTSMFFRPSQPCYHTDWSTSNLGTACGVVVTKFMYFHFLFRYYYYDNAVARSLKLKCISIVFFGNFKYVKFYKSI